MHPLGQRGKTSGRASEAGSKVRANADAKVRAVEHERRLLAVLDAVRPPGRAPGDPPGATGEGDRARPGRSRSGRVRPRHAPPKRSPTSTPAGTPGRTPGRTSGERTPPSTVPAAAGTLAKALAKALPTVGLALVLVYATLAAALVLDHRQYEGRVYPGVRMLEMDLGGDEPLGVIDRLDAATDGGGIATYAFELGGRPPADAEPGADPETFLWRGRELGVDFDVYESAQRAYEVGRAGGVLDRLAQRARSRLGPFLGLEPRRVAPDITYRPAAAEAAVGEMARALDREPEDAALVIGGGEDPGARVVPHERGLSVSRDGTLSNLGASLPELRTRVEISASRPYPRILTPAAEEAASVADRALTGGPVVVEDREAADFGAPRFQQIPRAALAPLIVVTPEPEEGAIGVSVDEAELAAQLDPILAAAARDPEDASLYFDANTDRVEVEPSREGRDPDGDALQRDVERSLLSGSKQYALSVEDVEPSFTTEEAEDVRPEDLLGGYTTAYRPGGGPADAVRFGNLSAAAAAVDGTLVPPGGAFSLSSALEAEGLSPQDFAGSAGPEGYVSDPSRPERPPVDDSAGLSQVATTLHAAVLLSGLSVTERYPTPEGAPPLPYVDGGVEASVASDGTTDLAFRNDTDAYLLLRARTDGAGEVGVSVEGRSGAYPEGSAPAQDLAGEEIFPGDDGFPAGAQEAWRATLTGPDGEEQTVSEDAYFYDAVEPPEPEPAPEEPSSEPEPEAGPQAGPQAEPQPEPEAEPEDDPETEGAGPDEIPEEGTDADEGSEEPEAEPGALPEILPEILPEEDPETEGTTPETTAPEDAGDSGASSLNSGDAP